MKFYTGQAEVQNEHSRQPLMSMETPELPFKVVALDLFVFEDKQYIVLVDYSQNTLKWMG